MTDTTLPTRDDLRAAVKAKYPDFATFEEYAAHHNITEEDFANYEQIRDWWLRDQLSEKLAPADDDLPPCPSLCLLPKPHRYESRIFDEATFLQTHEVTFERIHGGHKLLNEDGQTEWASITQEEHWTRGEVTLAPPVVSIYDDDIKELNPTEAHARAAEMRVQADQLDALADTLRGIADTP